MTNISDSIGNYVNDQNRELWNNLKSKYRFELFHDSNEYSWKTQRENGVVIIVCPNLEISYASFTHELLHTYIEDKGMTEFETFEASYKYDTILGNFVFSMLFSRCYNFFAHKKMYPYFKQMGFSEYDFVSDRIKYSTFQHFKTKMLFRIKKLRIFGIETFLGNFFELKNNVVKEDMGKCQKGLGKLKKLQPELYSIADRFDNIWKDQKDLDLLVPFNDFKHNLILWLGKNYSR